MKRTEVYLRMDENELKVIWNSVKDSAAEVRSDPTTKLWLDTCTPVSLDGGLLTLSVPNQFSKEKIDNDIKDPLLAFLKSKGIADKVAVAVGGASPQQSPAQPLVPEKPRQNSMGLLPEYVFDTFIVGKSNKLAHAASLAVSESPGRAYNPLFIWGGVGLGKTHLMHAIGHYVLSRSANAKVSYVSTENFTNDMISSIRSANTNEFRSRYRNLDVLLIDDIQFIGNREGTQEEFFNTFNSLHEAGKQIVICSDRPPKEIMGVEDRLVSRFEWGLVADIQQPDLETRIAILQKKAEMKNYSVPPEVIMFIAQNIPSNIRQLEGALNVVVANSTLNGEPMSADNIGLWLKNSFRFGGVSGETTIKDIQELSAASLGVTTDELMSSKRTTDVALARQIAMYLAREMLKLGYQQIGEIFNKRDHTTVIHACNKVEGMMSTDQRIRTIVDSIRNKLSQ